MNNGDSKEKKTMIEMIVIGIIIAVVVFLFMSNQSQADLSAAAANARVPLGEVVKGLMSKYF